MCFIAALLSPAFVSFFRDAVQMFGKLEEFSECSSLRDLVPQSSLFKKATMNNCKKSEAYSGW